MATQGGFEFVSLSTPNDTKARRKQVRSHAARNPRARKSKVVDYQKCNGPDDTVRKSPMEVLTVRRHYTASTSVYTRSASLAPIIPDQLGLPTMDPFQSFSRPLYRGDWFLISHFTSRLDLNAGPCPSVPLKDNNDISQTLLLSHWMQMAASDTGMLACILLAACRDLSSWSATEELRNKFGVMAAQFSTLAIRSVRESIARPDFKATDSTIIKTMAIGFDSAVQGDQTAVIAHTEALWRMVDLRGGFDMLRATGALAKMCIWTLNDQPIGPRTILPLSCIEREYLAADSVVGKTQTIPV